VVPIVRVLLPERLEPTQPLGSRSRGAAGAEAEAAWSSALDEAVAILRRGELVAFPTETVYGLGGRALDAAAALRIFAAKGRPRTHPLIVHVEGESDARELASHWSERAERLARAFWPGPLTLVVPRGARIPAVVAGGGDSIAVRAPAHPVARALIRRLGEPIAAPSANRYQSISPTLAEHVVKSLGDSVGLVLDGGACDAGIESTVVDVRGTHPRILRPGALGIAALRAIAPDIEGSSAAVPEDVSRASPGMDARHYAPRARVVLVETRDQAVQEAQALAEARGGGTRVGLVVRGVIAATRTRGDFDVRVLPDEPVAYAAALFATLHALDDAGANAIVVEAVPMAEAWLAVADRLARAST
jgi:L-threonylcarbamoyladenylate synthase